MTKAALSEDGGVGGGVRGGSLSRARVCLHQPGCKGQEAQGGGHHFKST